MNLVWDTAIGKSEGGVQYRAALPRLEEADAFEGREAFASFYTALREGFEKIGGGLSSVVIAGEGGVFLDSFVSVRLEITCFRDRRAERFSVRSQVWDLKNGVILSLKDLKLTQDLKRVGKWLRGEGKNGLGWDLGQGMIRLYRCDPNQADLPERRRSAYRSLLSEERLELSASALFSARGGSAFS